MEPLPKEEVTTPRWGRMPILSRPLRVGSLVHGLLPLVFVMTGCVTLGSFQEQDGPPGGVPCHAVVTWKNQVYFTPDPTRGGAPAPGLAGRLYLFDKKVGYPIACAGAVVVNVYDGAPLAAGKPPVLLEEWRIDKETLARLLHKDGIGWGYTLFLPWGTYRPDLRTVQFRLRFEREGAVPLYADISQVLLQQENQPSFSVPTTTTAPVPAPLSLTRPGETPRSQSFNLARNPE